MNKFILFARIPMVPGRGWYILLVSFLFLLFYPTVSSAAVTYTVAPGDTLYEISQHYGTTIQALQGANGLQGFMIYPGQKLVIPVDSKAKKEKATLVARRDIRPGSAKYTVRPGDSLYLIGRRYGVSVQAIIEANQLTSTLIYPGQVLLMPTGASGVPFLPGVSRQDVGDERVILARAASMLGKPYVYGGSGPDTFDCSGFTAYVFQSVGMSLPHNAAAQAQLGIPVSRGDLSPGDLVFFSYYGSGGINHVGIYVGQGRFIHASSSGGIKYSSLNESYYAANYKGARRLLR